MRVYSSRVYITVHKTWGQWGSWNSQELSFLFLNLHGGYFSRVLVWSKKAPVPRCPARNSESPSTESPMTPPWTPLDSCPGYRIICSRPSLGLGHHFCPARLHVLEIHVVHSPEKATIPLAVASQAPECEEGMGKNVPPSTTGRNGPQCLCNG